MTRIVKNRGIAQGHCASILRLFVALRLLVGLTIGLNDSAYAQGAGGQLVNVDPGTASFAAVQRYSAADRLRRQPLAVPENISVGPHYRLLLETMLANSPSFRRQCVRIAHERSLTVHVQHMPVLPVRLAGGMRGISHISRYSAGHIVAHVTLHPFDADVEMIAHEFEHIIEQLDDVDLAKKARRAHSGVHAIDPAASVFETKRARQVGLRVVEEIRQSTREGS